MAERVGNCRDLSVYPRKRCQSCELRTQALLLKSKRSPRASVRPIWTALAWANGRKSAASIAAVAGRPSVSRSRSEERMALRRGRGCEERILPGIHSIRALNLPCRTRFFLRHYTTLSYKIKGGLDLIVICFLILHFCIPYFYKSHFRLSLFYMSILILSILLLYERQILPVIEWQSLPVKTGKICRSGEAVARLKPFFERQHGACRG